MKPQREIKRHPMSIAWDEWLASDEGQQCRQANTLPHNTNQYLEHRLQRAFEAGSQAAIEWVEATQRRETSGI